MAKTMIQSIWLQMFKDYLLNPDVNLTIKMYTCFRLWHSHYNINKPRPNTNPNPEPKKQKSLKMHTLLMNCIIFLKINFLFLFKNVVVSLIIHFVQKCFHIVLNFFNSFINMDYHQQVINHMEILFLGENKIGIFTSCGRISTTVWLQHLESNKILLGARYIGNTQGYCVFWTNPGSNTLPNSNCTATYLLSDRLSD